MTLLSPTLRDRFLAQTTTRSLRTATRRPQAVADLTIRRATAKDFPAMLAIFRKVCETGDSYVFSADMPVAEVHDYWFGKAVEATWVAVDGGRVVGMYRLIPNQRGRGSHVANVAIMVDPAARGWGVGLALGRHLVAQARRLGFLAIQANIVAITNEAILGLARKLGFQEVGRLPLAFQHKKLGLVDACVLYLWL
jgi:L-amino acid N-acyltransferase YncA